MNTAPGTIAKNVVMDDITLPNGFTLQKDSISITGVPETITYNIDGDGVHADEQRENTPVTTNVDQAQSDATSDTDDQAQTTDGGEEANTFTTADASDESDDNAETLASIKDSILVTIDLAKTSLESGYFEDVLEIAETAKALIERLSSYNVPEEVVAAISEALNDAETAARNTDESAAIEAVENIINMVNAIEDSASPSEDGSGTETPTDGQGDNETHDLRESLCIA